MNSFHPKKESDSPLLVTQARNHMEYHLDIGKESGMPNKKLGHRLKFDKQEQCFDDLDLNVVKSVDGPLSKNKGLHQKKRVGKKVHESEEVVKYMSKLPSFLERRENLPDKAFSVGVLDWGLLEKWQHSRSEIIGRNEKHTPFNSNNSPFPLENESKLQESTPRVDKSLCHDTKKRLKEQGSKSHVGRISETRRLEHDNRATSSKGKMKVRHEVMTGREVIQATSCKVADHRDERSVDVNRHSHAGESSFSDCPEDVPHKADTTETQFNDSCSKDGSTKLLAEIKRTESSPGNSSLSPSRGTKLEEKNLGRVKKELKLKTGVSCVDKARIPSPTRRFSFDVGKMGKNPCSKETSEIPRSTNDSTIKSSSEVTCDKSNDNDRSRSSPLRRLLDPFFKRDLSSTDSAVKSSAPRGGSQSSHFINVKLDLKGCKTVNIVNPHNEKIQHNEKNGSSTVQALLQVAVKNGLPLFTFTVDNNREILAATVKTISSRKGTNEWIYTFFSVHEMKNKNRHWINQGGRDKNHGYIPNVVAQMRVSDILLSESCQMRVSDVLSSESCSPRCGMREFVLYSTGTKDVNHQTSDFLPIDELAAIIMKFPGKIHNERNHCSGTSEDVLSLTVVLPGGDHGLPGQGEPSPLIERWKSGGSCDCGGWDIGCKIQVLVNHGHSRERCSSTERQFELFSQDEVAEKKPIFSLSKFKDGIFSVEFSSSIKLLQAFSIGIASLNGMKLAIFSETDNVVGCKTSEDNMLKVSKQEASVKYASFPPLSPYGRV